MNINRSILNDETVNILPFYHFTSPAPASNFNKLFIYTEGIMEEGEGVRRGNASNKAEQLNLTLFAE